jgi:hypothetical protein
VVSWQTAIISFTGNNIIQKSAPYENFCKGNSDSNFVVIRTPYYSAYGESAKFCRQINGKMLFARNEKDLEYMLSTVGRSTLQIDCKNKFLFPIVRSQLNQSRWVYDFDTDEEVSFEPWIKTEPMVHIGLKECMYFDMSSRSQFRQLTFIVIVMKS